MNTTEGLAPLCRVLRISPSRVARWLCFTKNVKDGGLDILFGVFVALGTKEICPKRDLGRPMALPNPKGCKNN